MADIEIIREQTDGFTHQGHSVSYTDSYIKIRRSFRQNALRLLRGAPLSVFMEISLADEPPDVQTICANTGYTSTATVCAALDMLVDRNFIREIRRTGSNGVKCYAAINYTWSGSDRHPPQDIVDDPPRISNNEIRTKPPQSEIRPLQTKIRRLKSEVRRVHDMNDDVPNSNHSLDKTSSIHVRAEIEKILADAFVGINVQRLAERIDDPELAQAWVDWCNDSETLKQFRNPQGIAYRALMQAANARPAFFNKRQPAVRKPTISGKLADYRCTNESETERQ